MHIETMGHLITKELKPSVLKYRITSLRARQGECDTEVFSSVRYVPFRVQGVN